MKLAPYIFLLLTICTFVACENDKTQIESLYDDSVLKQEVIKEVELLYSDSAQVKLRIISPKMIRHLEGSKSIDEFPEGIHAEFLNPNQKVVSIMDGDYAQRIDKSGQILIRNNVVCTNAAKDKLFTEEIFYNEVEETLFTEKFVKIARPSQGDTIMGYGLFANQDFTRFEIKKSVSARLTIEEISKALE